MPDPNPHGDDQGTRIGSPDPGDPSRRNQSRNATGAGSEAAEGIHSAGSGRDPSQRSALESQATGWGDAESAEEKGSDGETSANQERAGSEPLADRDTEHRSGYGGAGADGGGYLDQRR